MPGIGKVKTCNITLRPVMITVIATAMADIFVHFAVSTVASAALI